MKLCTKMKKKYARISQCNRENVAAEIENDGSAPVEPAPSDAKVSIGVDGVIATSPRVRGLPRIN